MKSYNEKILVFLVDDDDYDCEVFEDALNVFYVNHTLKIFNDGPSVLSHLLTLENNLPDLIFLDLNLPKMSGIDCLKEIRKEKHLQQLSIAIYTTSATATDMEATFTAGANIFITKPSQFPELIKILKHVFDINWQYQFSGLDRDNFLIALS